MGTDIGKPGLDVGNAMGIVSCLRLGEQPFAFVVSFENDVEETFRAIGSFLSEAADAGTWRECEAPALDCNIARNGSEQGGLSNAVAADKSDSRAVGDPRRRTVKQQFAANPQ